MTIIKEKFLSLFIFFSLFLSPFTKLIAFTKRNCSFDKETVELISKAPFILEHFNQHDLLGDICYAHTSHASHSSHVSHSSHASHSSGSHYSHYSSSSGSPADLSSGEIATYIQNNNYQLTDPTFTSLVYSNSGSSQYIKENKSNSNANFNLGYSAHFSINSSFISLPFEILFKNSIISFELPYFLERLIKDDNSLKENSGFGDGLLRYGFKFNDYSRNKHTFDIYLKIPLGEYKNSLINKLTSLGSGSTDFIFDYHYFKNLEHSQFEGQIFYKLNTFSTQVYNNIKFKIKNGNIFYIDGNYDYFVNKKITLSTFFSSIISGQGKTIESSIEVTNNQNMFLIDLIPQVSYKIFGIDLILNIQIPFITDWEQDSSRKVITTFEIRGDLF